MCIMLEVMLEVQVQDMEVMEEHGGASAGAWIYTSTGDICMEIPLRVAWRYMKMHEET